jgi:hypothetical protein
MWIDIGPCMKYNWHSIRLVAHDFQISKYYYGVEVKGPPMGARLAGYLKEVLDRFELTDGHLLGMTTGQASANPVMTCELQTILEVSRPELPALRNHIPWMVHVVQLPMGAFIRSLCVTGCT